MKVSKGIYIMLALFLGGAGIHKFYAGKWGWGLLYLVFMWTYVPVALSLIDVVIAMLSPADEYGRISI